MSKSAAALALLALLALTSCVETSQDRVSIPLYVAGTPAGAPIETTRGARVELERAELAFGPLYLCAGLSAGELCETARLEWLDSVVVDALSGEAERAGELEGTSGPVRSWMYDLGISSQLTRSEPYVLDAARALDGASLALEGRALVSRASGPALEVPFRASIALAQTDETELGVPTVRRSTSDRFEREVGADERGLTVRFDPADWVVGVDFGAYLEDRACTEGERGVACAGSIEQSCAPGAEPTERDCGALEQICVASLGCAERVTIERGSQAWRSLRNALAAGSRPDFIWEAP